MKYHIIATIALASFLAFGCTPEEEPVQQEPQEKEETEQKDTPEPEPEPEPDPEPETDSTDVPEPVISDRLDTIVIHTAGGWDVTSKDEWQKDATIELHCADGKVEQLGGTSIKGRGNSTWGYPKKPYTLKLDSKKSLFGWPAGKRFNLLANWMDRTVMRNAVAFEIARRTKSLEWTPRGHYVELVLNGTHLGNYYFVEHIKLDDDRVPAEGGYLLEFDVYYDQQWKFHSQYFNMPVNIKEPDEDEMTDAIYEGIKADINAVEAALKSKDFPKDRSYADLIDVDTFIDWWLVHELSGNGEPGHPKSSYMYKAPDGKLKAGPVWDFDWYTFIPGTNNWVDTWTMWYGALFQDPVFTARVKEKWAESKADFESVATFIDDTADAIHTSAVANCAQWPISSNVNNDVNLPFDTAVALLRKAYVERVKWIDRNIQAL